MNYETCYNINLNYLRAKAFFEEGRAIHITSNRQIPGTDKKIFYNGKILELSEKYVKIDEEEEGLKTIFFFEIAKPIEERKLKEVENELF